MTALSSSDSDGEYNAEDNSFQTPNAAAAAQQQQQEAVFYTLAADTSEAVASLARKWSRGSDGVAAVGRRRRAHLRCTLAAWQFMTNSIAERVAAEKSGPDTFARYRAAFSDVVFATRVLQQELLPAQQQLAIVEEGSSASASASESASASAGKKPVLLLTTLSLQLAPALHSLELRGVRFGLPRAEMLRLDALTRACGESLPAALQTLALVDCEFPDILAPFATIAEKNSNAQQQQQQPVATPLLPDVPLLSFAGVSAAAASIGGDDEATTCVAPDTPATAAAMARGFDPSASFREMLQRGVEAANLSPLLPFVSGLPGCPALLSQRSLRRLQIAGAERTLRTVLGASHLAIVANTLHELCVIGTDEVLARMAAATVGIPSSSSSGNGSNNAFERKAIAEREERRLIAELERRRQQQQQQHVAAQNGCNNKNGATESRRLDSDMGFEPASSLSGRPIEVPLARAGSLNQVMRVNNHFQQRLQQQSGGAAAAAAAPSLLASVSQRTMWPLLQRLTLRGLRWRTVSPVLGTLPALAFLDVSQNEIATLLEPFPVLAQNTSLTALNLADNRLRCLGSGTESGLPPSITSLNVSRNFLQTFNAGGFPLGLPTLTGLREIDASQNLLLFWSDVHALLHRSWTLRRAVLHGNPFLDGTASEAANALAQCATTYPAECGYACIEDIVTVAAAPIRPRPAGAAAMTAALSSSNFSSAAAAGAAAARAHNEALRASAAANNSGSSIKPAKKHFVITAPDLALLMLAYTDPACPSLEVNGVAVQRADADFSRAAALAKAHAPFLAKLPYAAPSASASAGPSSLDMDDSAFDDARSTTTTTTAVRSQHNLMLAPPSRHQLGAPSIGGSDRSVTPGGRVVVRRVVRRRVVVGGGGAGGGHRSSKPATSTSGTKTPASGSGSSSSSRSSSSDGNTAAAKADNQPRSNALAEMADDDSAVAVPAVTTATTTTGAAAATMLVHRERVLSTDMLPDPDTVDAAHRSHHHHHVNRKTEAEASALADADGSTNPQVDSVADGVDGGEQAGDGAGGDAHEAVVPAAEKRRRRAAATKDRFAHLGPELHAFMSRMTGTLFAAEDAEHTPTMFAHPPKDIHSGSLLVEVLYSARPDKATLQQQQHQKRRGAHPAAALRYESGQSFVYALAVAEDCRCWRAALLKRELRDVPADRDAVLDGHLLATSTAALHPTHAAEWAVVAEFLVGDPLANGGATKLATVPPPSPPPPPPPSEQQGAAVPTAAPSSAPQFRVERVPGELRVVCYVAVSGPAPQLEHAEKFLRFELQHACADRDSGEQHSAITPAALPSTTASFLASAASAAASSSAPATPTLALVGCAAGGRRPWPIAAVAGIFHRGAVDGFDDFFAGERLKPFSSVLVTSAAAEAALAQQQRPELHEKRQHLEKSRVLYAPFEKVVDRIPPYDCGSSLPGLVHGIVDQSVAVHVSCTCPQHHRSKNNSSNSNPKGVAPVCHMLHCWAEFLPDRVLHLVPQDGRVLRRFSAQPPAASAEDPATSTAAAAAESPSSAVHTAVSTAAQVFNTTVSMPANVVGAAVGYVAGYFTTSASAQPAAVSAAASSSPSPLGVAANVDAPVPFLCLECFTDEERSNSTSANNTNWNNGASDGDLHPLTAWWMHDMRNALSHVSIAADAGAITLHALRGIKSICGPRDVTLSTHNATATFSLLWQLRNALHPVKLNLVVEPLEIHVPWPQQALPPASSSPVTASPATAANGGGSSSSSSSFARLHDAASSAAPLPAAKPTMIVGESLAPLTEERLLSRRLRHVEGCAISIVEPGWVGAGEQTLTNALRQLELDEKREADEARRRRKEQQQKQQQQQQHAAADGDEHSHETAPNGGKNNGSGAGGFLSTAGSLFSNIAATSRYFLGMQQQQQQAASAPSASENAMTAAVTALLAARRAEHQPAWLQYHAPGAIRWSGGWFVELSLLHAEHESAEEAQGQQRSSAETKSANDGSNNSDDDDDDGAERQRKTAAAEEEEQHVLFAFVVEDDEKNAQEEAEAAASSSAASSVHPRHGRVAAILTREDIVVVEVPAATGVPAALAPKSNADADDRDAREMTPLVFIVSMRCANGGPDMLVCVAAQQRSSMLRMLRRLCRTNTTTAAAAQLTVNVLPVTDWNNRLPSAHSSA